MNKFIVIAFVVLISYIVFTELFRHPALSRKAEIELTRLKSERDQAFKAIGEHQSRIEALKRDTAELAALINLTYQDIQKKESSLKALQIKIKQHEKADEIIFSWSNNVMDSIFRAKYPIADSAHKYPSKNWGVIN